MTKIEILEMIKGYKTISIIGMDKNVGKTTVLNHILNEARGKISLGLTSIGRDGEEKDRVTSTEKPKIYIEKGTYLATARQCLVKSDITKEIIDTTGINTPMGEIIIVKALSDGFVELGGPSINSYMKEICQRLLRLGSDFILVDGALSRRTSASPSITDAAILSTGAALNRDIHRVVDITRFTVRLLLMEKESDKRISDLCKNLMNDFRVGFINEQGETKGLKLQTALEASREITEELDRGFKYVAVKGILSDKLLEDIMKSTDKYKDSTFIIEDGTKIFLREETLNKFERQGGKLKVLNNINLVCVTCNPKAPFGYEFDKNKFLEELKRNIDLPVIDVIGGEGY